MPKGNLYIVATPIGNLEDFSQRAINVLSFVDLILAEDTRHSIKLLQHYGIKTPMQSFHEHNEQKIVMDIIAQLKKQKNIAVISDAGTPLVSDPGYELVTKAIDEDIKVCPIPGPCSIISALSVSGLATDRFVFEGYLPVKHTIRKKRLQQLAVEERTLIFLETPHRIVESLQDLITCMGANRIATLAKELTKQFETVRKAPLSDLLKWVKDDQKHQQGEFVILVQRAKRTAAGEAESIRVLQILLSAMPPGEAASLAAEILNTNRNSLYKLALGIKTAANKT